METLALTAVLALAIGTGIWTSRNSTAVQSTMAFLPS